ncbi:HWE histidine kinase domain-containing protein [Methylocapsa aurea]|uniref:HWE histidine kinase domain-containing protein n=1 Tax=Methylocapsa aurea TaxID=663610 RepID=UPI0006893CAD|nr:HWE histidine kinase domain-containing protein [Methylocapsa aurea]
MKQPIRSLIGRLPPLGFLFWGALILPLVVAASFSAILYNRSAADIELEAERTAAIAREHALRIFDAQQDAMAAIDLRLGGMSWDEIRRSDSIREFLAGLMQSSPRMAAILLIDPGGRIAVSSNLSGNSPSLTMKEDYAQALRAHARLYLGPALQDKTEAGIGFAAGRGPGAANGAIIIPTKARYFEDFWSTLAGVSTLMISIIRDDGVILARLSNVGERATTISEDSLFFELSRTQSAGLYRTRSSADGGDRLYAFAKLGSFPAYVRVSVDRDAAFAPWRAQTLALVAIAAGASLALATLVNMAQARETRLFAEIERRRRAETSLIARDEHVAALHKAESRLLLSGQRFRVAISAMAGIVYDWRISTGAIYRSDGLLKLLGCSVEEAGTSIAWWLARMHPDDRPRFELQRAKLGDGAIEEQAEEYRLRHRDGSWIHVWDRGSLIRDHQGKPVRVIGSAIDITERKNAEERQQILINELNHRVKNTLTTVQSITAQTARNVEDPVDMARRLQERFLALSKAHDQLIRTNWESVDLNELLENELTPYMEADSKITCAGPPAKLNAATAVAAALVLHELATNSGKYGAFSIDSGRLDVHWSIDAGDPPRARLTWREHGVPAAATPGKPGFGTRLIQRGLLGVGGGSTALEFLEGGVVCVLEMPLFAQPSDPPEIDPAAWNQRRSRRFDC